MLFLKWSKIFSKVTTFFRETSFFLSLILCLFSVFVEFKNILFFDIPQYFTCSKKWTNKNHYLKIVHAVVFYFLFLIFNILFYKKDTFWKIDNLFFIFNIFCRPSPPIRFNNLALKTLDISVKIMYDNVNFYPFLYINWCQQPWVWLQIWPTIFKYK